jgi:hypothetical protein
MHQLPIEMDNQQLFHQRCLLGSHEDIWRTKEGSGSIQ